MSAIPVPAPAPALPSLLIVDDEEGPRHSLRMVFRQDFNVHAVDTGDKAHLRWVRAEEEPALMAALARLAAAESLDLGEGSRYVGSFRAHGCLVPVWDLDRDAHSSEWEAPAAEFAARLADALAVTEPLTSAERRARDGILGRQFTLR